MTNSPAQTLVGTWSDWNYSIAKGEKAIFDKAFKGFTGATYKPICDATQLVNGTNYAFLCEVTKADRDATKSIAMVHIHVGLDGTATIQSIETIEPSPNNMPGGYSSWVSPVGKDAQKSFGEAMTLEGVSYELEACTTQVVGGINYVFLAKATPVVPNAKSYPVLINVFQPLQGKAQLEGIQRIKH